MTYSCVSKETCLNEEAKTCHASLKMNVASFFLSFHFALIHSLAQGVHLANLHSKDYFNRPFNASRDEIEEANLLLTAANKGG